MIKNILFGKKLSVKMERAILFLLCVPLRSQRSPHSLKKDRISNGVKLSFV